MDKFFLWNLSSYTSTFHINKHRDDDDDKMIRWITIMIKRRTKIVRNGYGLSLAQVKQHHQLEHHHHHHHCWLGWKKREFGRREANLFKLFSCIIQRWKLFLFAFGIKIDHKKSWIITIISFFYRKWMLLVKNSGHLGEHINLLTQTVTWMFSGKKSANK